MPLSENQMGYFGGLETVEFFWDIVTEEETQRTKKVTPPSVFETPVNHTSTEEGELFVYQDPKTAENISKGDGFTRQQPKTPKTMSSNKKKCPPAPKKPEKIESFIWVWWTIPFLRAVRRSF